MALKTPPKGDLSTWSVEELEERQRILAEARTAIRLNQNATDAALNAARLVAGLSDEQREAIAARAKGAD